MIPRLRSAIRISIRLPTVSSWINDRYCTTGGLPACARYRRRFTDQCFVDALKAFDELMQLGASTGRQFH